MGGGGVVWEEGGSRERGAISHKYHNKGKWTARARAWATPGSDRLIGRG